MAKAADHYKSFEKQCEGKLTVNQAEQKKLEDRLAKLKCEEEKLKNVIETGKDLQKNADAVKERTDQEVKEWRGRIEELSQRTETALQVMEEMKSKSLATIIKAKMK